MFETILLSMSFSVVLRISTSLYRITTSDMTGTPSKMSLRPVICPPFTDTTCTPDTNVPWLLVDNSELEHLLLSWIVKLYFISRLEQISFIPTNPRFVYPCWPKLISARLTKVSFGHLNSFQFLVNLFPVSNTLVVWLAQLSILQ